MSRSAISVIRCDFEDCPEHIEAEGPWLQEVVRRARMADWQTGRFGDYCPGHKSEGEHINMDALTSIEQALLKELLLKMRPKAADSHSCTTRATVG